MTPAQSRQGAKILIVDDDPSIIRLLAVYLKTAGFSQVRSLTDPRQALDECESFRPDLLILDVFMPRLSGFDVLEKLNARQGDYKVLILTCLDEPATREKALAAGACGVLGKPFSRSQALARIREALEKP